MSFYIPLTSHSPFACMLEQREPTHLAAYRVYFLSGEKISGAENIEASDDALALAEAEKLLLKGEFLAAEVWQGARLVGRRCIAPDVKIIPGGRSDPTKNP